MHKGHPDGDRVIFHIAHDGGLWPEDVPAHVMCAHRCSPVGFAIRDTK